MELGKSPHSLGFSSKSHAASPSELLLLLLLLLLLILPSCAPTQERAWEGVAVTGKLLDVNGRPIPGAHVYAYRENKTNTLGPADAMSEPTEADGAYILILPEGTYTLVARRRQSGSISGPLSNGDFSGQFSKPLHAGSGLRTGVDITLGVFRQGMEGDPKRILSTDTRIKGIIVDNNGAPVSGAYVFAYKGPFRQDPPDYMAPPANGDGWFEISLPEGGFYVIGARTSLGGKPRADDSMGFWGKRDQPREIMDGTVTEGVRIVVKPYEEQP